MALSFGNSAQGTLAAGASPTFSFLNNNTTSVSMFMLTYYSSGPEFAFSSSLSDPAGNTWHLRKRSILNSNYAGAGSTAGFKFITQEIWWTPNTVSNNRAITVNVVNSANVGMAHWMCRDVLGSLTPTAPWDTNTSFPAVQTFSSASATGSITTSGTTSQNNSMIVGILSEETSTLGSAVAVAGTGYTGIDNRTDGTSPNQFDMFLEDKILATAGSTTATCANNKQAFIFTMDAFSGTSTGTAAGDVGASLARLSSGLNNPGTGSPATVTYTNTDPCVIVLNVVTQSGSGGFTPITGVTDSAGVTWHRRSSKAYVSVFSGVSGGVNHITQEVWWATLTAAHASAVTVSVALSGTANQATGTLLEWITVTGSLTPNAPWDINAALPGMGAYSNAGGIDTLPSAPWTVSSSNAMVLNFLHQMTPTGTINVSSPPTGYVDTGTTQTIGVSTTGVAQAALAWIFGQSGSGTSTWVGGGAGGTGTREWILFADALTSDTTGSSADTTLGLQIHGNPVETFNGAPSTNTIAGTISTTVPTVLLAVVNTYNFTGSGAIVTVTGVSGGGLTWTKRSSTAGQNGTSFSLNQEVWWANATGALTAQTITATLSGTPSQSMDLMLFAVSGSPTPSAPFDTHAGLPVTLSKMNAGQLSSMTASNTTSSASGMLLAFAGYAWNAHTDSTIPPGYSDISTPTINHTLNAFWDEKTSVAGANTVTWGNTQEFFQITFDALNGSAAAAPSVTGTISTALTKASISAAALEKFTGTVATNLTKVSQSLVQTQPISGTVTTRLSKFNLTATDVEVFIGTITTNLSRINSAGAGASAREIFTGQITTRLSPAHMAAIGEEDFIGRVVTRLGNADGHIAATVVQAEVIVLGPIEMTLPPFRPLILGAKLGSPGAGKWYSWRHTDS